MAGGNLTAVSAAGDGAGPAEAWAAARCDERLDFISDMLDLSSDRLDVSSWVLILALVLFDISLDDTE